MTANDMMTLRALLEKSSDADLLREMIGFTAERLMALEVEGLAGAAHGERSPDRVNHRNGYRDRVWETRAVHGRAEARSEEGELLPRLPGAASDGGEGADRGDPGGLHPGRSTRSVDDLVQAMGMSGISKSQVSRPARSTARSRASLSARSRASGPISGWMRPI